MISTIIFDMDGVIVNSEPLHKEIEISVMHEFGVTMSDKEYNAFVGTTAKHMWSEVIEKYALKISPDDAIQKSKEKYYFHLYHTQKPEAIPGTIKLLNEIKANGKLNLVLASSSTAENINAVLTKHQLKDFFDVIVGGDQVEKGKPDPEIFLTAAKKSKTLPSQCIVIEDSRNGVEAAVAAGMRCIGFKDPTINKQLLYDADFVVDDMNTLTLPYIYEMLEKVRS